MFKRRLLSSSITFHNPTWLRRWVIKTLCLFIVWQLFCCVFPPLHLCLCISSKTFYFYLLGWGAKGDCEGGVHALGLPVPGDEASQHRAQLPQPLFQLPGHPEKPWVCQNGPEWNLQKHQGGILLIYRHFHLWKIWFSKWSMRTSFKTLTLSPVLSCRFSLPRTRQLRTSLIDPCWRTWATGLEWSLWLKTNQSCIQWVASSNSQTFVIRLFQCIFWVKTLNSSNVPSYVDLTIFLFFPGSGGEIPLARGLCQGSAGATVCGPICGQGPGIQFT